MTDLHNVIAAFVDGERVASAELAHALAAPEGREYLIDVLALRELVNDDPDLVSGREIVRKESLFSWPRLSVAAALLVTVTLGGYFAGVRQGELRTAVRDVQIVSPQALHLLPPPAPTQVIRLESGVNWREQIGGH
jgi:hypothetical protein